MQQTIAIIGRPNVGKSTLFNRLVGRRTALVHDEPGVTRDWREGVGEIANLSFRVIDTAGLDDADDNSLGGRIRRQTEAALSQADLVLFMFDARAGVTPVDRYFADWLRRFEKAILVVANKCESDAGSAGLAEAYALGFGDPIPMSAEHGEGIPLLYDALAPLLDPTPTERSDAGEGTPAGPIRLAVVGRPNVGKSTLVNALLGQERVLTGPEAGITRDSIAVAWECDGQAIELVDTAGLRRRARVTETLEKLAVEDSKRTVRFAQVVALVLDGPAMLEKQDLGIASQVVEEGRALVIVVTKWDLVDDKQAAMKLLQDRIERSLPQVRGIGVVSLSGLTGQNLDRFMPAVLKAYAIWNKRVATGSLNSWLEAATAKHPPPLTALKRRLRIRYATQTKARPPTFALFVNRPTELPDSYRRYLENGLREAFDLQGTPLRLVLRKGDNPYAAKKKPKRGGGRGRTGRRRQAARGA